MRQIRKATLSSCLLLLACSEAARPPFDPDPPQLSSAARDSARARTHWLSHGRFGYLQSVLTMQASIALRAGDGFTVTLSDRECAAQGNVVSLTSPVSATLTSSGCQEAIGRSWRYPGPYPGGTPVSFSFFSGYTNSAGQIQITGSYPQWTVACEDGYDGDFNDVVFTVQAFASCSTNDPILDDPAVREALKQALQQSGAFNNDPSARRETGGYMYRNPDGTVEVRANPDANATPCSASPGGPQPQAGEQVVGVWHTHPFRHMERLPANCGMGSSVAYDNRSRGGGSNADWEFIQTPYQGNKLPMYIIDKEQVFRLDPDTQPRDRRRNPNRFDWNTQRCQW